MANKLHLYPFIPIATMLAAGIVVGDQLVQPAYANATLCATIATIVAAIAAHTLSRRAEPANTLVLAGVALFGIWRAAYEKRTADIRLDMPPERYEAVVASPPVQKERTVLYELDVTSGRLAGHRINAYIQKDPTDTQTGTLRIGDGLYATSRMDSAVWSKRSAATHFDHERWLRTHGIVARTFIRNEAWHRCTTQLNNLSAIERIRLRLQRIRDDMLRQTPCRKMPQATYAVVAAMTMGDRSSLTREIRQTYSMSGASHILALSGMHLGIIYGVLSLLLARRRTRAMGRAAALAVIWTYTLMVGMPPSVMRAATMLTIFALASTASRQPVSPNTLAIAVTAQLATSAASLWDVGFQMSAMAVAGIIVCNERLRNIRTAHCIEACKPLKWVWQVVKVSLAAQIAVAPLSAYYFGTLPCYFLPTSLIVTPMATAIICGTLLTISTPFAPWLQNMAATAVEWLATSMNNILAYIASLPGANLSGLSISGIQTACIYALITLAVCLSVYAEKFFSARQTRRQA